MQYNHEHDNMVEEEDQADQDNNIDVNQVIKSYQRQAKHRLAIPSKIQINNSDNHLINKYITVSL